MKAKSPTNWGVQIAGMIFQTHSKPSGCKIVESVIYATSNYDISIVTLLTVAILRSFQLICRIGIYREGELVYSTNQNDASDIQF